MYPCDSSICTFLILAISHALAIVSRLFFNSFIRFFVILKITSFFSLLFKLFLSSSFSLMYHLPYHPSIFSLSNLYFMIYFFLFVGVIVISDGFTFVLSKIFILCPITSLLCTTSFTLGSHYAGSSSFVCAPPLTDCPRHVLACSAASISCCC